jgi:hypothetical protein
MTLCLTSASIALMRATSNRAFLPCEDLVEFANQLGEIHGFVRVTLCRCRL